MASPRSTLILALVLAEYAGHEVNEWGLVIDKNLIEEASVVAKFSSKDASRYFSLVDVSGSKLAASDETLWLTARYGTYPNSFPDSKIKIWMKAHESETHILV